MLKGDDIKNLLTCLTRTVEKVLHKFSGEEFPQNNREEISIKISFRIVVAFSTVSIIDFAERFVPIM